MLQSRVRGTLHKVKTRAKSNERLYNLVYDLANAAEFSDLYEHEKMLADSVRVEHYAAAIRRHVSPGDVVVDLGTGTGLLAIIAARQGATVYAIDHSEFIDVAEDIAAYNDVTGIQFEQVHSRDFEPPERVDVILHEQMGDDLFNENMVENVLDLKRRVLAEDGTILPGKFELFLEPVTLREEYRFPFVHELTVEDIDFGFLADHPRMRKYRPDGYARSFVDSAAVDGFLSTPAPMLSFDLNDLASEEELPTELSASRRVGAPGVMDGLCLYFRTEFDEEIQFDTSPLSTNTSWHNRVLRTPQREFDDGEEITYTVDADPLYNTGMWSVSVE
ncbi:methyltransferase domain-containing protein [Halolamina sp. CBA1230]|uniref:methyltransferase domain-containing protein n=1 Tax=Halolamina sp. CBA1230 TaxID=1853690 RepID=UPI0009A2461F|nr:methyltransferase domain-containing protein [Halolamina sp. CBA1230]QKY21354.1 methyltransferase domain-containing protein [Halolamina sp. CBA1230]